MSAGDIVYLRDALSPLSPAQDSPGDAARVLALEEERFTLAVLEAEDLAVRADKELALKETKKLAQYLNQYASTPLDSASPCSVFPLHFP